MSSNLFSDALCHPCKVLNPIDVEKAPLLVGDRQGFNLTAQNTNNKHAVYAAGKAEFDLSAYNDFDICLVWDSLAQESKKQMTSDQVQNALLSVCRARTGKSVQELHRIDRLHPVYGFTKEDFKACDQTEFRNRLYRAFRRVIKHVGAKCTEEIGHDKHKRLFVRVRMTEIGCQVIADYKGYPLQVDRKCTRFREFRNDPDFAPPYLLYEQSIETTARKDRGVGEKTVWQRYDRLARPMFDVDIDDPEVSIFRDVDRMRLLKMALFEFLNVEVMLREGYLKQCFVLKQPVREDALLQDWASLWHIWHWSQPIDAIRNYFGEEIAMYFGWLAYYSNALVVPAIVGLITALTIRACIKWETDEHHHWRSLIRAIYCVFIGLWSAFFFARWARREHLLSLRWGVETFKLAQAGKEENPFFKPDSYMVDPARPDRFVRTFSPTKRAFRKIATTIFLIVSTTIVVILVNDDLQDMLAQLIWGKEQVAGVEHSLAKLFNPNADAVAYTTWIALAVSLSLKVYNHLWTSMVSWRLGEFENHQLLVDYNDSVHFKHFIFKVSSIFAMLYFLAFFKRYFKDEQSISEDEAAGSSQPELAKQLMMFYVMDMTSAILECVVPYAKYLYARFLAKPEPDMPAYQYQAYLPAYTGFVGLTTDFLSKIVQFGYTALFSMAVPILPLLGMIETTFELRTDAVKLCRLYQRPFPRQADDIGIWDDLQRAMTFFGVLSNVFLCCFSTIGMRRSLTHRLAACLVLTLGALALKDYIEYKLPAESPKYELMKTRMQVVDYEALWGAKSGGAQQSSINKNLSTRS